MERDKLSAIAFIAIILGAVGAGVGAYAAGVTLTGGADGDDGDDGDDGAIGKDGTDGTIIGQVIQIKTNSTSVLYDINPATTVYSTLLSVEINVSAGTNLFCIATIGSIRVYNAGGPTAADLRLWLDNSIELVKASIYQPAAGEDFECCTLQNVYEGLSEGAHNATLQYRLHPGYSGRITINWDNADSVLTVMEIAD